MKMTTSFLTVSLRSFLPSHVEIKVPLESAEFPRRSEHRAARLESDTLDDERLEMQSVLSVISLSLLFWLSLVPHFPSVSSRGSLVRQKEAS